MRFQLNIPSSDGKFPPCTSVVCCSGLPGPQFTTQLGRWTYLSFNTLGIKRSAWCHHHFWVALRWDWAGTQSMTRQLWCCFLLVCCRQSWYEPLYSKLMLCVLFGVKILLKMLEGPASLKIQKKIWHLQQSWSQELEIKRGFSTYIIWRTFFSISSSSISICF